MRTRWTSLLVVAFALVGAARPADACQCVGPILTCAALTSAASVFEATVVSMALATVPGERIPETGAVIAGSDRKTRVTFGDVRAWRGAPASSVVTAPHEASCGYAFEIGKRYLVVAHHRSDGLLEVTRCGLTRPIAEARGIIDYLKTALGLPTPIIRVWGRVERAARWTDFAREFTGVPGATVTFDGPTRLAMTTAADGSYVADALPPGRYAVTVAVPSTLQELGRVPPTTIELGAAPESACLEVGFLAPIASSISGVVVDQQGRPVEDAFVTLRFPDQLDYSRGAAGAGFTTRVDGAFEFVDLPPGRYAVGIASRAQGPELAAGELLVTLRLGERVTIGPLVLRRQNQIRQSRRLP